MVSGEPCEKFFNSAVSLNPQVENQSSKAIVLMNAYTLRNLPRFAQQTWEMEIP